MARADALQSFAHADRDHDERHDGIGPTTSRLTCSAARPGEGLWRVDSQRRLLRCICVGRPAADRSHHCLSPRARVRKVIRMSRPVYVGAKQTTVPAAARASCSIVRRSTRCGPAGLRPTSPSWNRRGRTAARRRCGTPTKQAIQFAGY